MSRAVSVALKAHLASEVLTLAVCCKVVWNDSAGTTFGFTTHAEDVEYDGVTYLAATGISASEFSARAALNVDNLEIIGALDSASITEADIVAGLWDKAAVEFFILNYTDHSQGVMILQTGILGEVTIRDSEFVSELRGLMQMYQQNFGRAYLPSCDADYGDARCGHDPTSLTYGEVSTTVTSVPASNQRQFTASGLLAAADWYNGGKVEWTGGLNAGITSEVKTHSTGGAIVLQLPTPYAIAAADAFTITVGCDKSASMCASRFDNKINFRGFDKIPGRNRILSGQA